MFFPFMLLCIVFFIEFVCKVDSMKLSQLLIAKIKFIQISRTTGKTTLAY